MIFEILFKTLKGISVKEAYKNFNGFLGLIGYFGYFFADFGLSFLDFRIFWTTGALKRSFMLAKFRKKNARGFLQVWPTQCIGHVDMPATSVRLSLGN